MPVHSTWLAGVVTLLLGKRSGLGGGVGTKHVHQPPKMPKNVGLEGDVHVWDVGLGLNVMGAWLNRRDVQILSFAQNLSGRLTPTALRQKRAAGAFSLRSAPWRVRIPLPARN